MTEETLHRLHALMVEIESSTPTSRMARRHLAFAQAKLVQAEYSLRVALQAEAKPDVSRE